MTLRQGRGLTTRPSRTQRPAINDLSSGEQNSLDDKLAHQAVGHISSTQFLAASQAAGQQVWPSQDDFVFLFSARYNSNMFRKSYLQSEYRESIHETFTGMVDSIIERKLKVFSAHPSIYNAYAKRLAYTEQQSHAVMEKARLFGIRVEDLDVGALIYDVETSLQKMTNDIIPDHPELDEESSTWACDFINRQMWDEKEQLYWRHVTAETISSLYSYETISSPGIPLLRALDDMIHEAFISGELKGVDAQFYNFAELLGDDTIHDCLDALSDPELADLPIEWAVRDVLADIRESDSPDW